MWVRLMVEIQIGEDITHQTYSKMWVRNTLQNPHWMKTWLALLFSRLWIIWIIFFFGFVFFLQLGLSGTPKSHSEVRWRERTLTQLSFPSWQLKHDQLWQKRWRRWNWYRGVGYNASSTLWRGYIIKVFLNHDYTSYASCIITHD